MSAYPPAQGLYDPSQEHDACGVAFVADIAGRVTHDIVEQGLTALRNLDHRGASGSEPDTGDGAGILVQVPDAFLREVLDAELPEPGRLRVTMDGGDCGLSGAEICEYEYRVEDGALRPLD